MAHSLHQHLVVRIVCMACIAICVLVSIWTLYSCARMARSRAVTQHQAFRARGYTLFLLTSVVLSACLFLQPVLVAAAVLSPLLSYSWPVRLTTYASTMAFYGVIAYRCWVLHYNKNLMLAVVDVQWKQYLSSHLPSNFYIEHQRVCGARSLALWCFFAAHGALCVLACILTDVYADTDDAHAHSHSHSLRSTAVVHAVFANAVLFVVGCIHTRSYYLQRDVDLLKINHELFVILSIIVVRFVIDLVVVELVDRYYYEVSYVVYQTVFISMLNIVTIEIPKRVIRDWIRVETQGKLVHSRALRSHDSDEDDSLPKKNALTVLRQLSRSHAHSININIDTHHHRSNSENALRGNQFMSLASASAQDMVCVYPLVDFLNFPNGYRALTMFMVQEYSIENLLFITQWSQLKELIRISGILELESNNANTNANSNSNSNTDTHASTNTHAHANANENDNTDAADANDANSSTAQKSTTDTDNALHTNTNTNTSVEPRETPEAKAPFTPNANLLITRTPTMNQLLGSYPSSSYGHSSSARGNTAAASDDDENEDVDKKANANASARARETETETETDAHDDVDVVKVRDALSVLRFNLMAGGLLWIPSDVIVHSQSVLQMVRGLYDKYINCSDLLQINIGGSSIAPIDAFFIAHPSIPRIFVRDADSGRLTTNLQMLIANPMDFQPESDEDSNDDEDEKEEEKEDEQKEDEQKEDNHGDGNDNDKGAAAADTMVVAAHAPAVVGGLSITVDGVMIGRKDQSLIITRAVDAGATPTPTTTAGRNLRVLQNGSGDVSDSSNHSSNSGSASAGSERRRQKKQTPQTPSTRQHSQWQPSFPSAVDNEISMHASSLISGMMGRDDIDIDIGIGEDTRHSSPRMEKNKSNSGKSKTKTNTNTNTGTKLSGTMNSASKYVKGSKLRIAHLSSQTRKSLVNNFAKQQTLKCDLFVKQMRYNHEIDREMIMDVLFSFAGASMDIWSNIDNAYMRFKGTKEYKVIARSMMLESVPPTTAKSPSPHI